MSPEVAVRLESIKSSFSISPNFFFFTVSILAETYEVQQELLSHGIDVQNVGEIDEVFSIQPASSFARILSRL